MRRLKQLLPMIALALLFVVLWRFSVIHDRYKTKFHIEYLLGVVTFAIGAAVIAIRVAWLKSRKNDEYSDLRKEFSYLSQNTLTGVLIGIGFASTLVGISTFFYQPEETNMFREKIFEIVTIYLTTITSLLLIRAIFNKIAPITNVERLLFRIAEDLEELSGKKGSEAWFIYPALNIGYFREEAGLVPENYYTRFSDALHKFIENPFTKVTGVTYRTNLYGKLYETYVKMVLTDKDDAFLKEKTDDSVAEAKRKFNSIRDAGNLGCLCYEVEPNDLREHFIVIDDIVYTITSFGLPIYDATDGGTFKPPDLGNVPKDKLVRIYAYRQQDSDLAHMIKEKFKKALAGINPSTEGRTP
jgi:hypothetical protein